MKFALPWSLQGFWQRKYHYWLNRRLPRLATVRLNRKSIFTFPSRAGFGFASLLALLWLLATNYQNNVIFAFTFLLAAVAVVSVFHGYGNLSGLQFRVVAIDNGFPGDMLRVKIEVSQATGKARDGIHLYFASGGGVFHSKKTRSLSSQSSSTQAPLSTSIQASAKHSPQRLNLKKDEQKTDVVLFISAKTRGRQLLTRLTVETFYPLGLIRVWSTVSLKGTAIVFPQPKAGVAQYGGEGGVNEGKLNQQTGVDDFKGLAEYQQGESLNRIAWKQMARGQGVLTKQFYESAADPQWLDWNNYPHVDKETRLCRLSYDVIQAASKFNAAFGLKLPEQRSALGEGETHKESLLIMLALFEGDA